MTMCMSMYMTMNMCIIMCMNIYITKANEEFLRSKGSSMSGLVNSLLDKERGATPLQVAKERFSDTLGISTKELEDRFDSLEAEKTSYPRLKPTNDVEAAESLGQLPGAPITHVRPKEVHTRKLPPPISYKPTTNWGA